MNNVIDMSCHKIALKLKDCPWADYVIAGNIKRELLGGNPEALRKWNTVLEYIRRMK